MDFIKTDEVYSKYYDVMYILLYTGLRISEFCGLTLSDVDLEKRTISVNHQLLYGTNEKSNSNFYVEELKTESGLRTLPMSEEVCNCFRNIINNRKKPMTEMVVCGLSDFIYLNKKGRPSREADWWRCLKRICKKYNKAHTDKLPDITPHTCRHTYCSRMANKGINPKALQYLMGHANVNVTLNIYTHTRFEDVCEEINRIEQTAQD